MVPQISTRKLLRNAIFRPTIPDLLNLKLWGVGPAIAQSRPSGWFWRVPKFATVSRHVLSRCSLPSLHPRIGSPGFGPSPQLLHESLSIAAAGRLHSGSRSLPFCLLFSWVSAPFQIAFPETRAIFSPPQNASSLTSSFWFLISLLSHKLKLKCEVLLNFYCFCYSIYGGFPRDLVGKESSCNAVDSGSISRSGRSPGEGNGHPLHCSCLENPMDRVAWRAIGHGVAKSWTWQNDWPPHPIYIIL